MSLDQLIFGQIKDNVIINVKKIITDKEKRVGVIFITLLFLSALVGLLHGYYIKKTGVYIVATMIDAKPAPRGYVANIKYSYMYKTYEEIVSLNIDVANKENIGKRFIFIILQNHPTQMIYIDYAPDCLGENPPEGWSEIPKCE